MELRNLYDRLIKEGYWPIQIYQLVFLYRFLRERGERNRFFDFLNEIDSGYDTGCLEQLIKCITHDIPYELFIEGEYVRTETINEMRRYLEDSISLCRGTDKWEHYYLLAKKILASHWTPDMIYQFRRFLKCENPLKIEHLEKVYEFIDENNIRHWAIVNRLYETYVKKGIEALICQMNNKAFMKLIKDYHKNEESTDGDYTLMQIIEFSE